MKHLPYPTMTTLPGPCVVPSTVTGWVMIGSAEPIEIGVDLWIGPDYISVLGNLIGVAADGVTPAPNGIGISYQSWNAKLPPAAR